MCNKNDLLKLHNWHLSVSVDKKYFIYAWEENSNRQEREKEIWESLRGFKMAFFKNFQEWLYKSLSQAWNKTFHHTHFGISKTEKFEFPHSSYPTKCLSTMIIFNDRTLNGIKKILSKAGLIQKIFPCFIILLKTWGCTRFHSKLWWKMWW